MLAKPRSTSEETMDNAGDLNNFHDNNGDLQVIFRNSPNG
jgi:hypothetical protein